MRGLGAQVELLALLALDRDLDLESLVAEVREDEVGGLLALPAADTVKKAAKAPVDLISAKRSGESPASRTNFENTPLIEKASDARSSAIKPFR